MISDEAVDQRPAQVGNKFRFTGWGERQPIEVWLPEGRGLTSWRNIILNSTRLLGPELARLDAGLPPEIAAKEAYLESKQRRHFHLQLEASARTQRLLPSPIPFGRSSSQHAGSPAPAVDPWSRLSTKASAILAIGTGKTTDLPRALAEAKCNALTAGEGKLRPALIPMPDRYRPAENSFAGWLAMATEAERREVSAIVLGSKSTIADGELLLGRLYPHQSVWTRLGTEAGDWLSKTWDGRTEQAEGWLRCSEPGPKFREPSGFSKHELAAITWPKISVVTVSFNQAAFLEDCLKSVLDQNYPNLEYIVIDACSSDGSQDILESYRDRIDQLIIEPDSGQSEGLQKGLERATGDILTWINSDDMLAPNSLRRAALAFQTYGCDLVAGTCSRIGEKSEHLHLHYSALPTNQPSWLDPIPIFAWQHAWERGDYFFQPEVFFSGDIWRRTGAFIKPHLHWAMDWDLWIRCALAGASVVRIPDVLGVSRVQANQKTQADRLYLHQIANIFVEYDDLMAAAEASLPQLKAGPDFTLPPIPQSPAGPNWIDRLHASSLHQFNRAAHISRRLKKRLRKLRKRAKAPVKAMIVRGHEAVAKRIAMRQVSSAFPPPGTVPYAQHQELSARLHELRRHYDRLKRQYDEQQSKLEPAEDGIRDISNWLSSLLFETRESTPASDAFTILVSNGQAEAALQSLIVMSHERHGTRAFQLMQPLLARSRRLHLDDRTRAVIGDFQVVDIGAQPLETEADVYSRLTEHWPCGVVRFDPFSKEATELVQTPDQSIAPVQNHTLPYLVGDGRPGTFHINRMDATSSLLQGNLGLAERFGLLGLALQTAETKAVQTKRLDDLFEAGALGESIDFLKIDTQGTSFDILSNASTTLRSTLVIQAEAEFASVYRNEHQFYEIDGLLKAAGFGFLDFHMLGRQRYAAFDASEQRFYQAGRTLWSDTIYVRDLDNEDRLNDRELLKIAVILHEIYNKQDVAAHFLAIHDRRNNTNLAQSYINDTGA